MLVTNKKVKGPNNMLIGIGIHSTSTSRDVEAEEYFLLLLPAPY